jgi:cyclopropane fatty-acyl-phospholipid synthase-like methyltransferase
MNTDWNHASYRNRDPILRALRPHLLPGARVLEIGAGSGLHAMHLAYQMPDVTWQPTERPGQLDDLIETCSGVPLANVREPFALDLLDGPWPTSRFDAIVAINVLHIAPSEATTALFTEASSLLQPGGIVFTYGPFRYQSRPLESSNQKFDAYLQRNDPQSGLRVFDDVDALARAEGFALVEDQALPANNRGITWRFDDAPLPLCHELDRAARMSLAS